MMALNLSKDSNHIYTKWYKKSLKALMSAIYLFFLQIFIKSVTESIFLFICRSTSLSLADLDVKATNPIELQLPWINIWNKFAKNTDLLSNIKGNSTIIEKSV